MKEEIHKEILYDLSEAINILSVREPQDIPELKTLSDHAIEDVAVSKDLDVISITVLIYSMYKVTETLSDKEYKTLLHELQNAKTALEQNNYGKYNQSIRTLFQIVKKSSTQAKEHLQDVMQAARIKKGTALLEHGLSMGQAAGLMGLSNWDLQQYAGKTTSLEIHTESVPAKKRLQWALQLFGM